MEFKLGQKVKVKDSGVIYEIITNFENGQRTKTYSVISDIDNERIRLSENKIEEIESDEGIIKNIIKNIFKFKTKIFKKIKEINCYMVYSKCYSDMESIGLSAFECCSGIIGTFCDNCPYYRRNKEFETMKKEFINNKEITNGDKIRSMSDEELAKFITEDRWDCNECPSGQENMDNPFGSKCDNQCIKHCSEWLKTGVENG